MSVIAEFFGGKVPGIFGKYLPETGEILEKYLPGMEGILTENVPEMEGFVDKNVAEMEGLLNENVPELLETVPEPKTGQVNPLDVDGALKPNEVEPKGPENTDTDQNESLLQDVINSSVQNKLQNEGEKLIKKTNSPVDTNTTANDGSLLLEDNNGAAAHNSPYNILISQKKANLRGSESILNNGQN